VVGHLGCFHNLAIVNRGVHILIYIWFWRREEGTININICVNNKKMLFGVLLLRADVIGKFPENQRPP
jgi:hypothetical protein